MKGKKILKNIIILILAAACLLSAGIIASAEGNGDTGGGQGAGHGSNGSSLNSLYSRAWKVSVYTAESGKNLDKKSGVSNFNLVGIGIVYSTLRDGGGYSCSINSNYKVTTGNKFSYINGKNDVSFTNINGFTKTWTDDGCPIVWLDHPDRSKSQIDNYFNDENSYSLALIIAHQAGKNLDKNSIWFISYEPLIWFGFNSRGQCLMTPTDCAIAEGQMISNFTDPHRIGYITICGGCQVRYPKDTTWFGIGTGNDKFLWREGYTYCKNNWEKVKPSIVNFGGVGYTFSKAFDYPDYTVDISAQDNAWEKEQVTLTANVHSSNTAMEGKVTATLAYEGGQDAKIIGEAAKVLTFASGSGNTQQVTWNVDVGSYPDKSDARVRKFKVTLNSDRELIKDNNTAERNITLKRDFSVSKVSLNKTACFENDTVKATFSVYNNNPNRGYENVPIYVYLVDRKGTTTLVGKTKHSFGKGGSKNCTAEINVGTVTENRDQADKIYAVINSPNVGLSGIDAYFEPNMSNNRNTTANGDDGNIKVKRIIDLSVSNVNPNTDFSNKATSVYPGGDDTVYAVTSCIVQNHSRFNLYQSNLMNDTLTVHFFVNGNEIGKKNVNVPAKGSNLVYFKWAVPKSPGNVTIKTVLEWNINQEYHPANDDNEATMTAKVAEVTFHKTSDTQLEKKKGTSYSSANSYKKYSPYVARWSQWILTGSGIFEKVDYALSTENQTSLTPMNFDNGELSFANGSTIAAGSAFSLGYKYNIVTETYGSNGGKYSVPEDSYTFAQNVVASFPEFNYKTYENCRTLYVVNQGTDLKACSFEFDENENADGNQKVHFTPVNMPNGTYKVGVLGRDIWTPAGMIYSNSAASLTVSGSVYNDFYVA